MVRIEVGSSIPYLGSYLEISSSLKRLISEAGIVQYLTKYPFYRDKCALFHYFPFLNRWVSLKDEREFTYSKFQQIINSTTHHILCLGGSSIP
jgi:hypothetical protein